MSLRRLFHSAISNMVALNAHGALDYCLEQMKGNYALLHGDDINRHYKICILDVSGLIHDANMKMLKHLGLSREEFVGQSIFEILPKNVACRRMRMVRKALALGKTICFLDRRSGYAFESTIVPLRLASYCRYDRALCMARKVSLDEKTAPDWYGRSDATHVWERVELSSEP